LLAELQASKDEAINDTVRYRGSVFIVYTRISYGTSSQMYNYSGVAVPCAVLHT
jgi:hypothetical protein